MERHTDPGLQPERTTMAWTRTLVSFLVVAGLATRVAASMHELALMAVSAVSAMVALNIAMRQSSRYRRSNKWEVRPQVLSVFIMSTAVTALAVILLLILLF